VRTAIALTLQCLDFLISRLNLASTEDSVYVHFYACMYTVP